MVILFQRKTESNIWIILCVAVRKEVTSALHDSKMAPTFSWPRYTLQLSVVYAAAKLMTETQLMKSPFLQELA